jgi:hypothetical protein
MLKTGSLPKASASGAAAIRSASARIVARLFPQPVDVIADCRSATWWAIESATVLKSASVRILWVKNSRLFGGARTGTRLSALNIAPGEQ